MGENGRGLRVGENGRGLPGWERMVPGLPGWERMVED